MAVSVRMPSGKIRKVILGFATIAALLYCGVLYIRHELENTFSDECNELVAPGEPPKCRY